MPGPARSRRGHGEFPCLARGCAPLVRGDRNGPCHRPGSTDAGSGSKPNRWACASSTAMSRRCLSPTRASMPCCPRFGAMFAADQERAASEMIRVCRRGGQVGLANWTPDGFVGQLFKTVIRHAPPGPAADTLRLGHSGAHRGIVWRLRRHRIGRQTGRLPRPHSHGLGRQAARRPIFRSTASSRRSMRTRKRACVPTC